MSLLDGLCAKQFAIFQNNGKTLVSTSVNGMSFSYSEGTGLQPMDVVEMAIDVIKELKYLPESQIETTILSQNRGLTYSVFSTVL